MATATPAQLRDAVHRARKRTPTKWPRRRCFISYHRDDITVVTDFVAKFGHVLIPTALGVTDGADFVGSEDEDYIKRRIRELHLSSTTVTIVIAGRCTWSRQFVDWEIASSLSDHPRNRRSGLLAIRVPGLGEVKLPDRIDDNWISDSPDRSYAEVRSFPEDPDELREAIERAFAARRSSVHLVDNSRPLRTSDSVCG